MRFSTISALLLAPVAVFAQTAADPAFLQTVLGALTSANLTSLVSVLGGVANTTDGQALLAQLGGSNKTVFAPSNGAFASVPPSVAANTTLLGQILAYHILNNTYTIEGIAVSPANTIARTFLSGNEFVLPGNKTAPVVLSRNATNATTFNIVQATSNVSAMGPVSVANLQVYIIDEVLSLPGTVFSTTNAIDPPLAALLNTTTFYSRLDNSSDGVTIFGPVGEAITAAGPTLATLNSTAVFRVLQNHYINGSVVYSTELAARNYTSSGGTVFTVATNATGSFVTSGMVTARIIQSDLILRNGVVHVIDGVLANPEKNSTAAAGAFTSNTVADATKTDPVGAVTATDVVAATTSAAASAARRGWY